MYSENIDSLEERADHLPETELQTYTATSDFFNSIHKALISKGTKLIAGPRGSGKTHLMRFTYIKCKGDKKLPLCIYVSFNAYLRLEPFLKSKVDALDLFYTWVLARILQALGELINSLADDPDLTDMLVGFKAETLDYAISRLERGIASEIIMERDISISRVIDAINRTANHFSRKRSVILFDDAALTLTPEYMQELFEIIRSIKTATISPKASVYPGTTEYGPRFHVNHEAELISVWLPITSSSYSSVMDEIAMNRSHDIDSIPADVRNYIKYASFGMPRAFLVMLREFKHGDFRTTQQGLNRIIQAQNRQRESEYKSLALKVPKFQSLIEVGQSLINKMVIDLKSANHTLKQNKVQFIIGLVSAESPLEKRMLSLLVEAGLLYEETAAVSHGEQRNYKRYIPHTSILIEKKVFPESSIKGIVDFLSRRPSKHPVRRSLATLLGTEVDKLKLNIAPCTRCETPRLNDTQKFCHHCGSALIDESTFERCMKLNVHDVTHLTEWQKKKIKELKIEKIGDFLALQDPGTELRKLHRIGLKRATSIIGGIDYYVEEFLS
jgi:hypothetical protein